MYIFRCQPPPLWTTRPWQIHAVGRVLRRHEPYFETFFTEEHESLRESRGGWLLARNRTSTYGSSPQCKYTKSVFPTLNLIERVEFPAENDEEYDLSRPSDWPTSKVLKKMLHISDAWYCSIF
jgi:hypothetical protein